MNNDIAPPASPWTLFAEWFAVAKQQETSYPNAMMLATVGKDGMPTARAVLMKDYDDSGVVFYTNRESRKGQELAAQGKAGLCFYWKSIQKQIRIEGLVTQVSDAESDAYFTTRPRGSQIGAWASQQSRPLDNRRALEKRVADLEKDYEGKPVPRPPYWGGYRLIPSYFEFWQERDYRLHDRVTYYRDNETEWNIERLFP